MLRSSLHCLLANTLSIKKPAKKKKHGKVQGIFLVYQFVTVGETYTKYKTINFSKDTDNVPGIVQSVILINGNMN